MTNIPTSFMLMGDKWEVVVVEDPKNTDHYGECNHNENKIIIHKIVSGQTMTQSRIEATLYHEVAHAILCAMCRDGLNNDESFVNILSGLFHQFEITKTIPSHFRMEGNINGKSLSEVPKNSPKT